MTSVGPKSTEDAGLEAVSTSEGPIPVAGGRKRRGRDGRLVVLSRELVRSTQERAGGGGEKEMDDLPPSYILSTRSPAFIRTSWAGSWSAERE